ncbi:MAG: CHAD domain-containing protein [Pedobacter sp.]|nr:MAG: CHAD domain-containing protein [Pedobacter sp.]
MIVLCCYDREVSLEGIMEKKKIKSQVRKVGKSAKTALRGFLKKNDQDKLRQFRVGIKKLRAVASMIEATNTRIDIKDELKPVKDTYRVSGDIRDSHLHIQLAKTLPKADTRYLSSEKQVMTKATRKLCKNRLNHISKLRSAEKRLIKHIPKVKDKKIRDFYENELQGIAACLISSVEVEQLHGCRKRLKVLLYNFPLVKDSLHVAFNEEYLQQVQTAIGDWHDQVLAADQFPELKSSTQRMLKKVKSVTKNFHIRAIGQD